MIILIERIKNKINCRCYENMIRRNPEFRQLIEESAHEVMNDTSEGVDWRTLLRDLGEVVL